MKNKEEINLIYELIQKIPRILIEILFILLIVLLLIFLFNDLNQVKDFLPFLVFLSLVSIRMIPLFSNLLVVISSLKYLKPTVDIMIENMKKDQFVIKENLNIKSKDFKLDNLNIKNLFFKYNENSDLILSDINLKFEKNKIYCLIGETGCGKSTLLDLILGLLNPSKGKIIINNQFEIYKNDEEWYKKVSYVPQETFLLNETFKNNICFAEKKDEINENRFLESIKLACLENLYEKLIKSGDYNIGDRGIKLSGGQRQREESLEHYIIIKV